MQPAAAMRINMSILGKAEPFCQRAEEREAITIPAIEHTY